MNPSQLKSQGVGLPLLAFLAGMALIVHHGWRDTQQGFAEQEKRLRLAIDQTGTQMAGMSQNLLRKRLPNSLDLLLAYSSVAPDLDFGAIITNGDHITHATRSQWIGVRLSDSPLAKAGTLASQVMDMMEARIERESGGEAIIAAFPFWTRPDTRSKGAVILRYSLDRSKMIVWHETLHESISQGLSLAAGCLLFWLMLSQRTDMGRLYQVLEHARSLVVAPRSGAVRDDEDELDLFARSFSDAAEQFNETEEQLSRLAAGIKDVFWFVRLNRPHHPFVNDAYMSIWERESASELETRRWAWLRSVVAEDRRKAMNWLVRLQTNGQAEPIELRLRFPDSRIKWIECRGFALRHRRGIREDFSHHIRAVGGLVTDVTERIELERRLLEAAEDERRRIGQDLHDDVCQRMAAALLKGGMLQASLARSGRPEAKLAAEVTRDLSESTEVIRGFAQGLAPVVIVSEGLAASLEQLADYIERVFGVPCHSTCAPLQTELPVAAMTHLFRIAQELATNAARHADPTFIKISVRLSQRVLILEVSSDGKPFDGEPTVRSSGMGLHALRKHAEALGGRVMFTPSKNILGGTLVSCDVPLPII